MSSVARHHSLGLWPHYFNAASGMHGPTIQSVLSQMPVLDWDEEGVRLYLQKSPDGCRTCFAGVKMLPGGHEIVQNLGRCELVKKEGTQPAWDGTVRKALDRAMDDLAQEKRRCAIALSGGLDSALIVAMLRARGRDDIPVFTLVSGLPGYCEWETTRAIAARLGIADLRAIEITAAHMVGAFPAVISAAECPLFNLHPVSRWLLASELRAQGYEVLVTGDGADQVFAGSDPRNYLPIVGSLTRAAGMELYAPFLHAAVMASAPSPTPDKAALRAVAREFLPIDCVQRPKTPTYAPALDVSAHWRADAIAALAERLGLSAPQPGASPERVLWTSLGILTDFLN